MKALILVLVILLQGCGTLTNEKGINPYSQSLTEALGPDMFEVVAKRNNETDEWAGTDFRVRWMLK